MMEAIKNFDCDEIEISFKDDGKLYAALKEVAEEATGDGVEEGASNAEPEIPSVSSDGDNLPPPSDNGNA